MVPVEMKVLLQTATDISKIFFGLGCKVRTKLNCSGIKTHESMIRKYFKSNKKK
jgi:hypothetical protein